MWERVDCSVAAPYALIFIARICRSICSASAYRPRPDSEQQMFPIVVSVEGSSGPNTRCWTSSSSRCMGSACAHFFWYCRLAAKLPTVVSTCLCSGPRSLCLMPSTSRSRYSASAYLPWPMRESVKVCSALSRSSLSLGRCSDISHRILAIPCSMVHVNLCPHVWQRMNSEL